MGERSGYLKYTSFIIGAVMYTLVYFHRFCPAVLAVEMSKAYNVPTAELGVLTTMYFWSYGLMQAVIGPIADLVEPGYLMGVSGIVASCGAMISASTDSIIVSALARFLVGLGCSAVFVPMLKVLSTWFSAESFQYVPGMFMVFGGVGGIISQGPLAVMEATIGWRAALFILSIIGLVFSLLSFFFVKTKYQKESVFSLGSIVSNMDIVFRMKRFWTLSIYSFASPGVFMDVATFWGVPYLINTYGYSNKEASNIAMALSFSIIFSPPLWTVVASILKSKKLALVIACIGGVIVSVIMLFSVKSLSTFMLVLMLFLFGATSNGSQSLSLAMYKEMVGPDLTATISGLGNCFPFLGAAASQSISSFVIGKYGTDGYYPPTAFKLGLWVVCAAFMGFSLLGTLLTKEPLL